MQAVNEILKNKRIIKCPYCGKEYKQLTQTVFKGTNNEHTINIQIPVCDCEKKAEKEKKEKEIARQKKELLAKKFDNSLMTPLFKKKTFNNLTAGFGNEKELRQLQKYAQNFNKEDHKGIFLIGKPGTGKTTLLAAVCNDLINRGYNCLFVTLSELIEKFITYSCEHYGEIRPQLDWLIKFDFIVIDDIGRENYTDRRKEIVFRIIDTILNYQVTTAFTANPENIEKLSKIGEWAAILDRLKDICAIQINFNGESVRGRAWQ